METLDNPLWGDDWTEVRALFDTLQPGHAYLNHGGFGNSPRTVLLGQQQWRARMDANATRFFRRELAPGMATASRAVAEFLGAPAGDSVALVTNVTAATSIAVGSVPLAAGDEFLVTDHGYPTSNRAVERRARDTGASVVTARIPLEADAAEIAETVLAAVTPRTKVALIDHVTSSTARRFPVEELVPALQERGVIVIVDAAHAPGMVPIDLATLNPDFWGGNLHKWGYVPRSAGAFWAAPKWRPVLRNPIVSWGEDDEFPVNLQEIGTNDPTSRLSAPHGISFLRALGPQRVREHNVKLAEYGQAALASALDVDPATLPGDPGVSMRLVPLPVPYDDPRDLQAEISDRLGVEVSVPKWNGLTLLRVSANVYNAPAEYDRLAAGIRALL
ncbi:aminotransferase class V [Catenulispora acidiphila DSM 44928]|uniref:Aminotransferase class V n=1 Tax=Catenulispora acidiphila (strain DSM 44928 / JCM 14897 / NBRC 102108 / NRRL B-24433 / ID139908) TaxID=479433 RepID=C7QAU5_CATAD|nr:aminotransferase class V-fold PLP-dependent enzyme [Catenulispora acidiphila]ACU74418.1 aminotransferase class V [Catenulispora acidiphila DSM 44928]